MKKVLILIFLFIIIMFLKPINSKTNIIVHDTNYLCNFHTKSKEQTSPIIILNGEEDVYITKGSTYYELGAKAIDNCDGDITNKVITKGKVNTNEEGVYQIKYQVKDKNNNKKEMKRNIHVKKDDEKGSIYLTFDDGPSSSITPKILDILTEEQIKATFFVINHPINTDYLLKRILKEGHTIGLHSYTHDYSYIYSSIDNYFSDLNKIKEKVYNITGIESNIIRFPGGTSNLVSKKYASGIMSKIEKEVTNKGYIYYDWNIESRDAGGVTSSEEVYNNVVNNLSLNQINIVLLHDFENNNYTLEALPKIIKYAKENGYIFKNITKNTPQIKHKVNN